MFFNIMLTVCDWLTTLECPSSLAPIAIITNAQSIASLLHFSSSASPWSLLGRCPWVGSPFLCGRLWMLSWTFWTWQRHLQRHLRSWGRRWGRRTRPSGRWWGFRRGRCLRWRGRCTRRSCSYRGTCPLSWGGSTLACAPLYASWAGRWTEILTTIRLIDTFLK